MSWLRSFFRFREHANPDGTKPFLDHLEDLRLMIIKVAVTTIGGMFFAFSIRTHLVQLMQKPLRDIDPDLVQNLQIFGPFDSIIISFKLAFYAGIVITFPVLLFFLAQFILPALTMKEKKLVFPSIGVGFFLFALGVCFSYFYVIPTTLEFCFKDAASLDWTLRPTASHYFSFVTNMTLALGLAFELPVVVMLLNFIGVLPHALMVKTRIFAWPALLTLAAIIAPSPDPMTMLALGAPLVILYEICIVLAWILDLRKRKKNLLPAPPDAGP